jgi:hypothetical protein
MVSSVFAIESHYFIASSEYENCVHYYYLPGVRILNNSYQYKISCKVWEYNEAENTYFWDRTAILELYYTKLCQLDNNTFWIFGTSDGVMNFTYRDTSYIGLYSGTMWPTHPNSYCTFGFYGNSYETIKNTITVGTFRLYTDNNEPIYGNFKLVFEVFDNLNRSDIEFNFINETKIPAVEQTTTSTTIATTTTIPSGDLESRVSALENLTSKFIQAICSIKYSTYFGFCPPRCSSPYSCSSTCVDDMIPSYCYDRTIHSEYFCSYNTVCCESKRVTCPK